jgi:bifunctional non-homologous end joining protein LigD
MSTGMARISKLPKRLQPMLATLIDAPFDNPDWVFESKWDGFRMIASIDGGKVALYSRNSEVVTERYTPIAKALGAIGHDAVIDGELVALDAHGRSRFQLLQNAMRATANLRYCMFDIMFLDGEDLRSLPLLVRKERLRNIMPKDCVLVFSRHRRKQGTRYFEEAATDGEEGIMAKRADSIYVSGARTKSWLKIKAGKRQEIAIVGFTAPRRSRKYFGALVIALRDGKQWRYAGHVGTGFSNAMLETLHAKLWPLRTTKSPFQQRVKDEAVTTWVKLKLVAEVKFAEWTSAGEMRHPAFLGLREDKKPEDVVLEKEAPPPE